MEIPAFHVMTHDSIGLGEDGPTHQPVEQIASLRAMPGLLVLRPGDANEVTECYRVVMESKHHPAILRLQPAGAPHVRPDEGRSRERECERAPTCWPTPRVASPRCC